MAKDKRNDTKETIQNVQPPASAPVPGIEQAYHGDKPLPKRNSAYKSDLHLNKEPLLGAKHGEGRQQDAGPQGSQGRRPPKCEVTQAESRMRGTAKKSAETQTEWNRHDKKG